MWLESYCSYKIVKWSLVLKKKNLDLIIFPYHPALWISGVNPTLELKVCLTPPTRSSRCISLFFTFFPGLKSRPKHLKHKHVPHCNRTTEELHILTVKLHGRTPVWVCWASGNVYKQKSTAVHSGKVGSSSTQHQSPRRKTIVHFLMARKNTWARKTHNSVHVYH